MDQAEALASGLAQLVADSIVLEPVEPLSFLRSVGGSARGLWARGEEWVAHAGAVQVIASDDGEGRFEHVRSEAARLVERSAGAGGPLYDARFYGGFSFRSNHRPEGLWRAYPPALFHLPELELFETRERAVLRGWTTVGPEEDAAGARARLRDRLQALASELTASEESFGDVRPIPCDRHASNPGLWRAAVEDALDAIRTEKVSKVVLARTLDVTSETPLDPLRVVDYMWRENRGAHVFLFEPTPGHWLLGAAPETIATVRGQTFRATAVAGSIARGGTGEEQRALAARLLASEKDRIEHRIALDDMVERLRPFTDEVDAESEPHVLTLARIQHLETRIRAHIPAETHVLDVLAALHPTPAVCGLPRDAALEVLDEEEPFDRGWYAGPVGWFDATGDGIFAPALRCAVGHGREWRLFAGAGIVGASDPALEWEETGMKFEPVLRALEASGAR